MYNKSVSIVPILIACALILTLSAFMSSYRSASADSSITTYTYSSTTNKSAADIHCHCCDVWPSNPTNTCNGGDSWHAADSTDMSNIASDNNVRWQTDLTRIAEERNIQRYLISIDEDTSKVTRIDVNWQGYGCSGSYQTDTKIYNYGGSSWTTLSSQTDKSSDTLFSGSITSSCSNYFSGQQLAVMAAAEQNADEWCPQLFVWNGDNYQYIDSATSGRILKRLSGTDYPSSNAIVPVNGYYDLMIFQPVMDTTYIDSLGLWAIDHPEGTEIIADDTGTIHTVREPHTVSAFDSYGNDVTPALSSIDENSWDPNITGKDISDEKQLQDWIEFTLPDAPKEGTAKIIINAKYTALSLLQVWGYFIYILGSPNHEALLERAETDSDFIPCFDYTMWDCTALQLHIWNGSDWVYDSYIQVSDGGSHIAFLNLSNVQDSRIRLSVPAGAFSIDYLAVDYTEDENVTVVDIEPAEATKYFHFEQHYLYLFKKLPGLFRVGLNELLNQDVLDQITDVDGSYAILRIGDYLNYKFEASLYEPAVGMSRSFVFPSNGYYITEGPEVPENKSENWPLIEDITCDPVAFDNWIYPRYIDYLDEGAIIYPCNQYNLSYAIEPPFPVKHGEHSLNTDYLEVKITWDHTPSIGTVSLWTTGASPTETTSMNPQVEYNIKVPVTDGATLNDVDTVKITLYYDSDGTYSAGEVPSSGNTQTAAILTWTRGGSPAWTIDPSSSTTWSIETANCVQPTLTEKTGTFEFHFKPGKVATQTTSSAKWHAHVSATDGNAVTASKQNLTMAWYGEIAVNTGTINWGTITAGQDFAEGDPSEEAGIRVEYICNGAYNQQVKSDTSWTGSPSGSATLNSSGTPGANEFSLKADDDGTLDAAVIVSDSYQTFDTGTITSESGNAETGNSLWLSIGTPFIKATYSGTIYYQIAH